MDALHRKSLSPAFRMAVLAGAMESVRLHLRSGGGVDAVDEKGRSPLILAASRGRVEICRFLLEEGADPAVKDCQGNDALTMALSRGDAEIAALLANSRVSAEQPSSGEAASESREDTGTPAEAVVPPSGTVNAPPPTAEVLDGADAESLADGEALTDARLQLDAEDAINPSAWQEELEGPPPLDDPSCASGAAVFQKLLSLHVPVDTDESWDDVEIDLPDPQDLVRRRTSLTPEQHQSIRVLLLTALRDGRVQAGRIARALQAADGPDDAEDDDSEANLRVVLGDLGVVIDDSPFAPDRFLNADEDTDGKFGDDANDALAFLRNLQSNDADTLSLYLEESA